MSTWSEWIVTGFLGLSLIAYVISGGADFGVGILEWVSKSERRAEIRKAGERALAPVWEANHIWIILALVILFVAFPSIHVRMTTHLHIPLVLMLVGIVLRGTAFTFRYYDVPGEDHGESDRLWTFLFRAGSVMVPFVFGHLAAAMSRGRLLAEPAGVWESYLAPWLGWFPLACGLFTVVLFAWLAAVFLVGEQVPKRRAQWVSRARRWTVYIVVSGGSVSLAAAIEGVPWFADLTHRPLVFVFVVGATISVLLLWPSLSRGSIWWTRVLAGATVLCILGGYFGAVYPTAIELQGHAPITWHEAIAGEATLTAMASALVFGSMLILPGLAFLYRLFKLPVDA